MKKDECYKIVLAAFPQIIKLLNVEQDVIFEVKHSRQNKEMIAGNKPKDTAGYTEDLGGKFRIVVFYNNQKNKKDCLGTIFHELLHVKFSKLSAEYYNNKPKGLALEEELVVCLENVFVEVLSNYHQS